MPHPRSALHPRSREAANAGVWRQRSGIGCRIELVDIAVLKIEQVISSYKISCKSKEYDMIGPHCQAIMAPETNAWESCADPQTMIWSKYFGDLEQRLTADDTKKTCDRLHRRMAYGRESKQLRLYAAVLQCWHGSLSELPGSDR